MAVRLQVYGEVFPLTFYAKIDMAPDIRLEHTPGYLWRTVEAAPVVACAWLGLAAALAGGRLGRQARLIAAPIALHTLYVIWTGGDHMPAARFFVILVAPAALLLVALDADAGRGRLGLVPVAAAGTIAAALLHAPRAMDPAAFVGTIVGHHIERTWPRDIEIALNTAGSTPFHASEGRVFIDMLGLNDPVIAKRADVPVLTMGQAVPGHGKGDGAYVLARAPDRIILGPAQGADASTPWFLSDAELLREPGFHRCYVRVVERIAYSEAFAALGPARPNPLPFTWYRRICP
jgi:hypothetical protein